jgi:hypothetical protein
MAELSMKDGSSLILAVRNNDTLKVIRPMTRNQQELRPARNEVSVELIYADGGKEYREFYYGSGYLSQSSRRCKIPAGVSSVVFSSYKGESRKVSINTSSKK